VKNNFHNRQAQGAWLLEIPFRLEPCTLVYLLLPLSEKKVIYLRLYLIMEVVENLTPSDAQLDDT
jgi:hypothetical protein